MWGRESTEPKRVYLAGFLKMVLRFECKWVILLQSYGTPVQTAEDKWDVLGGHGNVTACENQMFVLRPAAVKAAGCSLLL